MIAYGEQKILQRCIIMFRESYFPLGLPFKFGIFWFMSIFPLFRLLLYCIFVFLIILFVVVIIIIMTMLLRKKWKCANINTSFHIVLYFTYIHITWNKGILPCLKLKNNYDSILEMLPLKQIIRMYLTELFLHCS